jgi:hypothetical protein
LFRTVSAKTESPPQPQAGTNIAGIHPSMEEFMKRKLTHCPLRFAAAQAYDQSSSGRGSLRVERSIEEYSLVEPIDAAHGHAAVDSGLASSAVERSFRLDDVGATCLNPLREAPSPLVVGAVKRFGLVGLVACAVGTGLARRWHSFRLSFK